MSSFSDLKTGITFTLIKGDVRQPHNYAMERVSAGYSRWMIASQYHADIERILRELKVAVSFVSSSPDDQFLLQHPINLEDYIMYHQGYFLDLVHQLKDKLCQLVNAIITAEKNYSGKDEKETKLKKLLKNKIALKVHGLCESLKKWDDDTDSGYISNVLKKRTFYHHFKNPLPNHDDYQKAKTNRFLLSPSFESQLSDYGKQMIVERGEQSLRSWQVDTADKMTTTFATVEANIENISNSLINYYNLPCTNDQNKRLVLQYMRLDETLEVPDSKYSLEAIKQPNRRMLEMLIESLPFILGEKFISLYTIGSIPRGNFIWGISDLNFVVVTKNNQPEFKDIIQKFVDTPANEFKIPIDARILSEEEFMSDEQSKLRFICRTDGLLLAGVNLLTKEKNSNKICFKLAWLLNKDFKGFILSLKKEISDQNRTFTEQELMFKARSLCKKAYWLGFSMVIGNNTRYTPNFREMHELNNFFYPENSKFNNYIYHLLASYPMVSREDLVSAIESVEEKLIPMYNAIDAVVNGVSVK